MKIANALAGLWVFEKVAVLFKLTRLVAGKP
jgi:hypothetical protein